MRSGKCDCGVEPKVFVFDLPLPPNMGNQRGHWRARHRARDSYFDACDLAQAAGLVPPPPVTPIRQARATAVLRVFNPHDDDNATLRAYKLPLDWLRTRGYLTNDSRKHVRVSVPEQEIDRKTDGGVRLTITPLTA